jgi:hypothetical protein
MKGQYVRLQNTKDTKRTSCSHPNGHSVTQKLDSYGTRRYTTVLTTA